MKRLIIPILFCLIVNIAFSQKARKNDNSKIEKYVQPMNRVFQVINSNWTFNYVPSGIEDSKFASSTYNDQSWKAIAIPHTWQTYETTKEVHPFILSASERLDPYWWNGWGWYRKQIIVDKKLEGKRISIEFDGVQKYSKVYVNGNYIGDHKGGYTSFYFDITKYLKYGQQNIIAVAVSNRRNDTHGNIPPSTAGNFNVYGGIYRDVRLLVTDLVYIPYQGSYKHEGGTFITTPAVSAEQATVNVKTFIKNETKETKEVRIVSVITDHNSQKICSVETTKSIKPDTIVAFVQADNIIKMPKLWSPESPYLYMVYTEVYSNKKLVDVYKSPLGIRWFNWDYKENKLYVNGKKIHIHGTNRHQEYPWLGDAIPKWLTAMDLNDIRYNLNHNFMRTGHYPNDEFVYDYNDKNGIITVEEVPNIKPIQFDDEVQENNVREMVRRDRNHPSIFFWSVGNETKDAADSKWVHEEDTTRLIHERKTEGYGKFVNHDASNLDMENLLRVTIRGWYNKDVKDLEPTNNARIEKSGQQAGTEEWQHKMARVSNGSIRGRIDEDIVAWLYEDHGCDRIYKDAPLQNVNAKGWTDMYRVPKYMYYLWQANYSKTPMIFIHTHFWRMQYVGQKKNIQVDSNCEELELFVNNKSFGKLFPTKENFYTVEFQNIPVEKGKIKVVGKNGKNKIVKSLTMADAPNKIILSASHNNIPADRSGLSIITADIVDKNGVHVYGATHTLKWEVIGEGRLVGHNLYESDTNKNSEKSGSGYIDAPVSNIVRSTNLPGKIKVKVSAPGLLHAEIEIESVPVVKNSKIGIIEPNLLNQTNNEVIRDNNFQDKVEYVEEMKRIVSPEVITAATTDEYKKAMQKFVIERNPEIDKKSVEFKALITRLTTYIENVKGELTEDDYNFIARSYNDCRMIARTIDSKNWNTLYSNSLRENYSTEMLINSELNDVNTEIQLINGIPREINLIQIVPVADSKKGLEVEYERTLYIYKVKANTLEKAIELMVPDYSSLTAIDKQKFVEYLDKININIWKEGVDYKYAPKAIIAIPPQGTLN